MIHGPDLSVVQTAAKNAVMEHFVGLAEADGTPPTLRAFYVLKTAEARTVIAGGSSDLISGEATLRGVTPAALAQTILDMAAQSEALELARMKANVAIEAAADETGIHAVLDGLGVSMSIPA